MRRLILAVLLIVLLFVTACSADLPPDKIDRHPPAPAPNTTMWMTPPETDTSMPFVMPVDLCEADLSTLDLRDSEEVLALSTFDDHTIWPSEDNLPADFDWQQMMEIGKNPGLGVRALHDRGITGEGVSIGMIGPPLLIEHQEYVDRIRLYEEINVGPSEEASELGTKMASLTVGQTVGVAPNANLYYIGINAMETGSDGEETTSLAYYVQAIQRLVEVNSTLPAVQKIHVIVTVSGWFDGQPGYEEIVAAVQQAGKAGIAVVSYTIYTGPNSRIEINGLGRDPYADPDSMDSYTRGIFWADWAYSDFLYEQQLFPMDSRTYASPLAEDAYAFEHVGYPSDAVLYLGGLYALTLQVDPNITLPYFLTMLKSTGQTLKFEAGGKIRNNGKMVDPVTLIEAVE